MEGRIKPSPVLNAPPAKESDPFCTSATLLPLRRCRRNTFQKRRVSAAFSPSSRPSQRCFQPSLLLLPMCDFGPRPFLESFDLRLDVRSVLFVLPTSGIQGALRLGDRSLPSLSFLLLGGLFRAFGAPGTDTVAFGCTVTFKRDDGRVQKYRIVGEDEADPKA